MINFGLWSHSFIEHWIAEKWQIEILVAGCIFLVCYIFNSIFKLTNIGALVIVKLVPLEQNS